MSLPQTMRRVFTGLYALITFTFVALVAYAATAGAFFADPTQKIQNAHNPSRESDAASKEKGIQCGAEIAHLYDYLVDRGALLMRPGSRRTPAAPSKAWQDGDANIVEQWTEDTQYFLRRHHQLKRSCKGSKDTVRKIKALKRLYQAYTTAIRSFHSRGRTALLELAPSATPKQ